MRVLQSFVITCMFCLFISCSDLLFPPFFVASDSVNSQFMQANELSSVIIVFSQEPSPLSVDKAFSLLENDIEKKGRFEFSGKNVTFIPYDGFVEGKDYVLKVTTAAESDSGISLEKDYIHKFHTKDELLSPLVTGMVPENNAVISIDPGQIVIKFSEPLDQESLKTAFSISPSVPVLFEFAADGESVTVLFSEPIVRGQRYIVTIDTSVSDIAGNGMRLPFVSSFLFDSDITAPVHTLEYKDENGVFQILTPLVLQHGIPDGTDFRILFDEPVKIESVQNYVKFVPPVAYTVKPDFENKMQIDFVLTSNLEWDTSYQIFFKQGITDLAGNKQQTDTVYTISCDAEHDRPITVFRGYFDRLVGPDQYGVFSPSHNFEDLALDVISFPTTTTQVPTKLFFIIGLSAEALNIPLISAFSSFSVTDTNSCVDVNIRSISVLPLSDSAIPLAIKNEIANDPILSAYPGIIRVVQVTIEVENSENQGLVYFRVSQNLRDDCGNALLADWEAVLNKN